MEALPEPVALGVDATGHQAIPRVSDLAPAQPGFGKKADGGGKVAGIGYRERSEGARGTQKVRGGGGGKAGGLDTAQNYRGCRSAQGRRVRLLTRW